MKKNHYYLAIDTAFEHGRVVVFSDDTIHFDCLLDHKTSQSTRIFAAISDGCRLVNDDIVGIFVGLGPGSFIGLRIALATGLGFSLGRAIPLMGFCSQRALAFSHGDDKNNLALITKASGDLVYFTRYQKEHHAFHLTIETQVLEKAQAFAQVCQDKGIHIISNLELGDDVVPVFGPSARGILSVCQEKIAAGIIDESAFITPNYVKAPNVSFPKKSPIIAQLAGSTGRELAL